MMRVLIFKPTNKLIEAQSNAKVGTLIENAIRAGYSLSDIEERVISEEVYRSLLRTPEIIAMEEAAARKIQDIADNLPSWQQVSDAIDAATTIAACKVILKRLARVVYWLAKNKND